MRIPLSARVKFLLIKAMADSHLYSQSLIPLQAALADLGHEAVISDQAPHVTDGAATTHHLVQELEATRYDAVVSFSSFFGGVTLGDGRSVFDVLGVKFVGWQFDHPIYVPQSLARALQGRYAIYSSPNHLRFAQAVRLPGAGMTMLAGAKPPATPPKPWRDRTHALMVAATWNGVPRRTWEHAADGVGKQLVVEVVERLTSDPMVSVVDAVDNTCKRLGLAFRFGDDPQLDAQVGDLLRDPLTYVRNIDRIAVVTALVDAGLPVTIYGAGWADHLGPRPNVEYRAPVGLDELSAAYGDARVVLNLNAGNGACERAVNAAAQGAAVLSDHSPALADLFGDALGAFNRARPATAAAVAGRLLDERHGEAVARRGHDRVMGAGLWTHRAAQLAAFVEAA